jgi:hypothetical protein
MNQLKRDWFVKDSVERTLKNIIEAADLVYLRTVPPETFEKLLITEVQTISPYGREEAAAVENYIHSHRDELYAFAQKIASTLTR